MSQQKYQPPSSALMYRLTRYTDKLDVWPDTEEARKYLTLVWREMQQQGRGRRAYVHHRTKMYKASLDSIGDVPGLLTFQGFWHGLAEHLRSKGRIVAVLDKRDEFPKPDIAAAIRPLRPYQIMPLVNFLQSDSSGMKGAPTRWGKTYDIAGMCLAYQGIRIVISAPGVDLCVQLKNDLQNILGRGISVVGIYTGSGNKTQGPQVTVCCCDSLHHCDAENTKLLILDETHAWASDERIAKVTLFKNARVFSLGATLNGRSDRRDRVLPGLIGPVLSNVTYLEAVACKAISPCTVIVYRHRLSEAETARASNRETAYKLALYRSPIMAAITRRILTEAIPPNWQVMGFIADEKQADFYMKEALAKAGVVAMAKKLKPKERNILTKEIAAARHTRVIASNIYIQGVTFPDLRVLINLAGGGSNTGTIQKPGRLLQIRPGKNYGVMIDFEFLQGPGCAAEGAWTALRWESRARIAAYQAIGYNIVYVDTVDEIKNIIDNAYENKGVVDEPVPQPTGRRSRAPRVVVPTE